MDRTDGLFTYVGMSLKKALKDLDRLLPVEAYKAMTIDRKVFTDIQPAFQWELLSELFGPLGLGWGYEILSQIRDDAHAYCEISIRCWYTVYREGDAAPASRVEWVANGGSSNAGNREWAIKGALTNALGAAWSLQNYQSSVYKGVRDHESVVKEWRDLGVLTTPVQPAEKPAESSPTPSKPQADQATSSKSQEKKSSDKNTPEEKPSAEEGQASPSENTPPADDSSESPLDVIFGRLKAADVSYSISSDAEMIYALPGYSNAAQKKAVTDSGGKWDSKITAETHKLRDKAGAYVIKIPA